MKIIYLRHPIPYSLLEAKFIHSHFKFQFVTNNLIPQHFLLICPRFSQCWAFNPSAKNGTLANSKDDGSSEVCVWVCVCVSLPFILRTQYILLSLLFFFCSAYPESIKCLYCNMSPPYFIVVLLSFFAILYVFVCLLCACVSICVCGLLLALCSCKQALQQILCENCQMNVPFHAMTKRQKGQISAVFA